jgi:hypothetical protein
MNTAYEILTEIRGTGTNIWSEITLEDYNIENNNFRIKYKQNKMYNKY